MMDKIIKDNLNFIQLPRDIRKDQLINDARTLQEKHWGEENYTNDIKPYYRDACLNRYFWTDYKWRLVQNEYTKKLYCEVIE